MYSSSLPGDNSSDPSPLPGQPSLEGRNGAGSDSDSTRSAIESERERSEPGVYPAIVPSNSRDSLMDGIYGGVRIPGFGSCLPKCSDPEYSKRTVVCSADPSHFHMEVQGSSCGRVECPQCHVTWENRAADRAGARIDGFLRYTRNPPKHVIYSLSSEEIASLGYGEAPYHVLEKRALNILMQKVEDSGIFGGAAIFHPWRFRKDRIPLEALKVMKASEVVRRNPDKFSEWMSFEPHVHIVGYGYLKKVGKDSGFQYKNKGSLRSREDIERVIRYALSHTWIDLSVQRQKHKVRYFGSCSYRKLKPVGLRTIKAERICPVCGAVLIYEDSRRVFYDRMTIADSWIYQSSRVDAIPGAEVNR